MCVLAMALSKRDRVAGSAPLIASTIMISFSLRHVSGLCGFALALVDAGAAVVIMCVIGPLPFVSLSI